MKKRLSLSLALSLALALILAMFSYAVAEETTPPPAKPGEVRKPIAGPMKDYYADKEVKELTDKLKAKTNELLTLFNTEKVDESKARAVNNEINELRNKLSEKRLLYYLEFKKNNPDWKPAVNRPAQRVRRPPVKPGGPAAPGDK